MTPEAPPSRETRQWWAVIDDDVRLVTGYSCAPGNPGYWWCPEAGSSMSEGHHLFNHESIALDKLICELESKHSDISKRLVKIRRRRTML